MTYKAAINLTDKLKKEHALDVLAVFSRMEDLYVLPPVASSTEKKYGNETILLEWDDVLKSKSSILFLQFFPGYILCTHEHEIENEWIKIYERAFPYAEFLSLNAGVLLEITKLPVNKVAGKSMQYNKIKTSRKTNN